MSKQNNLTEIWNVYSDSIIKEGKTATRPIEGGDKKMGTKPGPGAVDLNSKEAQKIQNTGNEGTTDPVYDIEGLEEPIDPKNTKGKENLYEPEKYSSEKFDKKVEKSYKESININMKSVFDKLFEEVMDGQESNEELDALGIEAGDEGAGEESGDITVTLDKEMAKQLCDILQAAIGEEDPEAEDMEHEDMEHEDEEYYGEEDEEDGEDEDEDETHKEAVDATDEGHPLVNQKTGNPTPVTGGANQVKSVVSSKAKKGSGGKNSKPKITGYSVSDEGHALVNQKDSGLSKVSSGSNKVAYSAGEDAYQSN